MCKQCRIEAGEIPAVKPEPEWVDPVDEAVVLRLLAGHPVQAKIVERTEAIARLDAYGYSAEQIAQRLRMSQRTVVRHRARLRVDA